MGLKILFRTKIQQSGSEHLYISFSNVHLSEYPVPEMGLRDQGKFF